MKFLFVLVVALSSTLLVTAQDATAARTKTFNLNQGIAIQGYDPVAYHTQQKAIKGRKDVAYTYQGATYYFATVANKEVFQKNPTVYEPQYGGWCAYAMSKGEKVEVDPETFKLIDHKLYLFYNRFFNNTLKSWNKDEAHLKVSADKSWNKLFQ